MESGSTRRDFLKSAAGGAALALGGLSLPGAERPLGSNDRISVGVIGCGSRGADALMPECRQASEKHNVEITAVCDPWNRMRQEAAAKVKRWFGRDALQFKHYQELLDRKDIDAVIIACPDHQHCTVLSAAARAGKDIYCEKPLAMELGELKEAADAVRASGRVFQTGTQLRSKPSFTGCRDLVRSGALGKIIRMEQNRNTYKPYWHGYVRPIQEADTDWRLFLMNRPFRPWDPDQYSAWYGYRDFSSGPIGAFMSHFIDLVHYVTGAKFPRSAVAQGGIFAWKDARTCPDSIQTILEYPEGFLVSYSSSFGNGNFSFTHFCGTKGSIDATDWDNPVLSGEGIDAPDRVREKKPVPPVDRLPHMEDWLSCLRSRKQPNADIDAAYQHAVACILADSAYVSGRRMVYDAEKREIRPG